MTRTVTGSKTELAAIAAVNLDALTPTHRAELKRTKAEVPRCVRDDDGRGDGRKAINPDRRDLPP